jgi:hypothetical protein
MSLKYLGQVDGLLDAVAHSPHKILIRCNIEPKTVERTELECLFWSFAVREHIFKIK